MAKKSKKQKRNEAKLLRKQTRLLQIKANVAEANMKKAQSKVLANRLKESPTRRKAKEFTTDLKVNLAAAMKKYNVQEAKVGETPYQVKLWVRAPKSIRRQAVYVESNVVVNMSEADYKRYKKVLEMAKKAGVDAPVITPEFFGDTEAHLATYESRVSPEHQALLDGLATFNFLTSVVRAYPPELQYAIAKAMMENPKKFTDKEIGKHVKKKERKLLDQVYGSDNPETDAETINAVLKVFPEFEKYRDRALRKGYSQADFLEKIDYLNRRALLVKFED